MMHLPQGSHGEEDGDDARAVQTAHEGTEADHTQEVEDNDNKSTR